MLGGVLWSSPALSEPSAPLVTIGEASLPGRDALLYREFHFASGGEHHRIEYRAPGGDALAYSLLDYSEGSATPAFRQWHASSGELKGFVFEQGRWQGVQRADFSATERRSPLRHGQPLVIGPGFDRFIREHWDALESGKSLVFDFAIAGWRRAIPLQVKRVSSNDSGLILRDPHWMYLRVRPVNGLVSLVAPTIDIAYRPDHRLAAYRGASNLWDVSQRRFPEVEIRYAYPGDPPFDNSAAQGIALSLGCRAMPERAC